MKSKKTAGQIRVGVIGVGCGQTLMHQASAPPHYFPPVICLGRTCNQRTNPTRSGPQRSG